MSEFTADQLEEMRRVACDSRWSDRRDYARYALTLLDEKAEVERVSTEVLRKYRTQLTAARLVVEELKAHGSALACKQCHDALRAYADTVKGEK